MAVVSFYLSRELSYFMYFAFMQSYLPYQIYLFIQASHFVEIPRGGKSLLNIWYDEKCHPKTVVVIDNRLKVWDDKDQL